MQIFDQVIGEIAAAREPVEQERRQPRRAMPAERADDSDILELPRVIAVEIFREEPFAAVERGPVAIDADEVAEIGRAISRTRAKSISSGSTIPCRGCSIAQIIPPSTAAVTCSEVALLCGATRRASAIDRREPYQ